MSSFDVRVFSIRRRPGRAVFEVRWRVAGRGRSRSFMTRALADSYRAELVRVARRGVAFDPETGEPAARAAAEAVTVTWYQHAVAYAEMKWPGLAPHSRASLADALATVTPLLTREACRRPPGSTLRAALYGHAFNPPQRRSRALDPVTATALAWLERASLPVSQLSDPQVIRAALDGLCTGWTARPPQRTRSRVSGRCSAVPWAMPSSSGCCPPTRSARSGGARPEPLSPSIRSPSPARRRSGRSLPRSPASGRSWPRSSAACTTRRCARKKPSRCAAPTSSSRPAAAGRSSSPRPARAPAPPGPAPASLMSRPVSSTAPTAPSASSHPARPGRHALPSPRRPWHHAGREAVPRRPRRHTQRVGLRPRLARRPPGRARPGPGRHRARPPPLRPAARRPVPVAQRHRRTRRSRRPGRHQHTRPARRLRPLH